MHDSLGKLGQLRLVAVSAAQNDEFVAADPRDKVVVMRMRAKDGGCVRQHRIAGLVAKRVVDLFEPIEIDMQNGIDRHVLRQHLVQISAVGQVGQIVVQRVVFDPCACLFKLAVARLGRGLRPTQLFLPDNVFRDIPIGADELGAPSAASRP